MLFNSSTYFLFLLLCLLVYWTLPARYRLSFLLGASYVFYAFWNVPFIALILASTSIDYLVSHALSRAASPVRRRWLLTFCITVNLLVLSVFKYCNFFLDSVTAGLHLFGWNGAILHLDVILPLGISFYTFEAISYVVDVYRGGAPVRSFRNYSLYIMFFPHLIAGPIVRFRDIVGQFEAGPKITGERIMEGIFLLGAGFIGKTVLADNLAPIADLIFTRSLPISSLDAWIGTLAFSGQIYFDFAAYTAMARGSALLFGFTLTQNFHAPYLSPNIAAFWQRWHISLSSWLRDYLYIPLGGNRGSTLFTFRNLIITMVLGGLWHGASWQFMFWGLLHGALLVCHRTFRRIVPAPTGVAPLPQRFAGTLATFLAVSFAWIFFRAPSMASAGLIVTSLVGCGWQPIVVSHLDVAGVVLLALTMPIAEMWWLRHAPKDLVALHRPVRTAMILTCGVVVWVLFAATSSQRFIYFQF
jgi:alginate O-acetyltransferase complex protein AlgI